MIKKARNIFFEYFYNLVETIVNEDFANAASEMAFMMAIGIFPFMLFLMAVFGWLGKKYKKPTQKTWVVLIVACVCTAGFTLLDCIISSLFYGFTVSATKAYLLASLPVCGIQTICTGVTVGVLFIPLTNTFLRVVKM